MIPVFANEEEMKDQLIKWLNSKGFLTARRIYIGGPELDVVALGNILITKNEDKRINNELVYVFETKIATTRNLLKAVIEQAILRMLVADYVYIVVPDKAEVWVDEKRKEITEPPFGAKKIASGIYSSKIGIIAMESKGHIEVVRQAQRTGLALTNLKNDIIKNIRRPSKLDEYL
jgi:hypothetical protein